MTIDLPGLQTTIERFNHGCEQFAEAAAAWRRSDFADHNNALRDAIRDIMGSLEDALQIAIPARMPSPLTDADHDRIQKMRLNELLSTYNQGASPERRIEPESVQSLISLKQNARNPAEHRRAIPAANEIHIAIGHVRAAILRILDVDPSALLDPPWPFTTPPDPTHLRNDYFELLRSIHAYLDLAGIPPRFSGDVIKANLADLFVPPTGLLTTTFYGPPDADDDRLPFDPFPDLADILSHPRVVLLGDPGAGKTSLTRYIAYAVASGDTRHLPPDVAELIPVRIRAVEYAARLATSPPLGLHDVVTAAGDDRYAPLIDWAIRSGRALVLIDGLDEVADPGLRLRVATRISDYVARYPRNRFLITSRLVGYRENQLRGDFQHYTLNPFDHAQMYQFLTNWYTAIERQTAPDRSGKLPHQLASALLGDINASPSLSELAGNPLLLTIIALTNWREGKLPRKRVELLDGFLTTLTRNWPLAHRDLELDADRIRSIFQVVAYQMIGSSFANLIPETTLLGWLELELCADRSVHDPAEEARRILTVVEEHAGFFLSLDLDENRRPRYGFLHLTFAEYLAAIHLAEIWRARELDLAARLTDQRWYEVLRLAAAHIGSQSRIEATRFVRSILGNGEDYREAGLTEVAPELQNLLFAARIVRDGVPVRPEFHDELVRVLIAFAFFCERSEMLFDVAEDLAALVAAAPLSEEARAALASSDEDTPIDTILKLGLRARLGDRSDSNLHTLLKAIVIEEEDDPSPDLDAVDEWTTLPEDDIEVWDAAPDDGDEPTHILVATDDPDEDASEIADFALHAFGLGHDIGGAYPNFLTHVLYIRSSYLLSLTVVFGDEADQILRVWPEIGTFAHLDNPVPWHQQPIWLIAIQDVINLGAAGIAALLADNDDPDLVVTLDAALRFGAAVARTLHDLLDQLVQATDPAEIRSLLHALLLLAPDATDFDIRHRYDVLREAVSEEAFAPADATPEPSFLEGEFYPPLIEWAMRQNDPVLRLDAFRLATRLSFNLPAYADLLRARLDDPDPSIRYAALTLQFQLPYDPDAYEVLTAEFPRLTRDLSAPVRLHALNLFSQGRTQYPAVGHDLTALAADLRADFLSDLTRYATVFGTPDDPETAELLALGTRDVVETLHSPPAPSGVTPSEETELHLAIRPEAFNDPDPSTRRTAALLLSYLGPQTSARRLLLPLLSDADPVVRRFAIAGLAPADLERKIVVDALIDGVASTDLRTRSVAAAVLTAVQDPELRQLSAAALHRHRLAQPDNDDATAALDILRGSDEET